MVVKSLPLPDWGEGDISTNGNFLYKRKTYILLLEHWLILSGLYFKIILISKRYILGWLNPVSLGAMSLA